MMLQDPEKNAHRAQLRRQRKERERTHGNTPNNSRKRKLQLALQEQYNMQAKRTAPIPPAQFLNSLQLTPPTSKRELANIFQMNPIEKASYDDQRQWLVDIPQFALTPPTSLGCYACR